jgi:hypothetical protein
MFIFWGDIMYHKLIATVIFAAVITTMSTGNTEEFNRAFNSSELKILFSDTTVKWTNPKGIKITLTLNSDGSARVLAVSPQQKVKRRGKWWIKEPNIHCIRWVDIKRNICRQIGIVEKREEGFSTNVRGMTWTVKKDNIQVALTRGLSVEDYLKNVAVELRKSIPQKGNGLTMVGVNTQGKKFQYIYELDNKLNEIPKPALDKWKTTVKGTVIPGVCNAKVGKNIRDHAVIYQYTYLSKDKLPVLDFNISEKTCF